MCTKITVTEVKDWWETEIRASAQLRKIEARKTGGSGKLEYVWSPQSLKITSVIESYT